MQKEYSFFYRAIALFLLLGILFIPFPFYFISFQQSFTEFVFGKLIAITASTFFGLQLSSTAVHSDSASMYVLVLLLFFFSLLFSLAFSFTSKWNKFQSLLVQAIYLICTYYLVLLLMKYGLDKVFKTQFYLPEPNTLYTPLGQVDKDLLYWTSMGTSRLYNMFTGMVEVMAALLLLFKRTRMAGSFLAAAALFQVVMINFGFDISVKIFSLFLFCIACYVLAPYMPRLFRAFFTNKEVAATSPAVKAVPGRRIFIHVFIQCFIVGLLFFEAVYPYLRDKNFNDDLAPRPYLHGAYEVKRMILGTDTLSDDSRIIQKFFIHRNGYLIFQDAQQQMSDYKFDYSDSLHMYVMTDYQRNKIPVATRYQEADSVLILEYKQRGNTIQLMGKALNWKALPAVRKGFHWTAN
jgi:hypothetical protein